MNDHRLMVTIPSGSTHVMSTGQDRQSRLVFQHLQAGGLSAISRWLSAAIPPEDRRDTRPHPGGMPAIRRHQIHASVRQPAFWHPSGMRSMGTTETGGVADHVHMLVGLKATHCLADFLRELKKGSSAWVHNEIHCPSFAWQEGYAAFTVSATARDAVRSYIANQEEHHRKKSFRAELAEMLERAGVSYDSKYLD